MAVFMRILELLSVSRKLKNSKPHVLRALSGLAVLIMLGVFATMMAALLVAGLLWLIYVQMVEAGMNDIAAFLIVAILGLAAIIATVAAARRAWTEVRADIDLLMASQTPVVGQVADKVTNVAGAFLSGLRQRRTK